MHVSAKPVRRFPLSPAADVIVYPCCRGAAEARAAAGALMALPVLALVAAAQPLGAARAWATPPGESAGANLPGQLSPVSVTFVSLRQGWVLGTIPCSQAGECLVLRSTNNAGKTWSASPLPPSLLDLVDRKISGVPQVEPGPGFFGVRFADPRDGWLFGGVEEGNTFVPLLWATHNAGSSWVRQAVLPGMTAGIGPVMDVEAAAGKVYALVPGATSAVLDYSPVSRNDWRPVPTGRLSWPAGGAQPSGSIVVQAGNGWVLVGNDRGITGTARLAGGKWGPWAPPCGGVGDSYTVPAARNANDLAAVCQMGGFASPVSRAAPPGARQGSSWLYLSSDAGVHFVARTELSTSPTVNFGTIAYPNAGELLVAEQSTTSKLVASFDGGRHWGLVYSGEVFYLGFTSPRQGVGLVVLPPAPGCKATSVCGQRRTAMIMSFDGGRHWQQVNFGI